MAYRVSLATPAEAGAHAPFGHAREAALGFRDQTGNLTYMPS